MVVEKGYKQTEVGVIPEDWELCSLGDFGIFSKGSGVRKDQANSGELPCVRYGELYTKHNYYIKKFYSFISPSISKEAKKLKIGDILFAGSGETKSEIGKSAAFINNHEAYAGGDIVIFSPNGMDSLFLGYLLNAPFIQSQKASKGQGDAVVHISASSLSAIKVPTPSLPEQTAIANALSDMEALIAQTEKLIEKKKAIKQGAMQELLKPKEGWVTKKLGDLVDKVTTGKLDANAMKPDGEYRFYTCAKEYYFIDRYSFDDEALLISGNGANVGYIHYYKGKFNAYQRTYVLIGFQIDVSFLKIYLDKHLADRITTEVSAGNTPYIKMDTITEMVVQYPPESNEQSAISNQINDINIEIELINTKLQKLKHQKQGMMQALLTGKIRLI